ncbi:carnitine O-acetyltransferase isoform X1 [Gadus chalcogrammus]|uniref:carnitine O-acetyltransferase isoform X1 n=1 Tax=Gadus chalcogrammus TaxID=1042646 RepID=UPI0024C2B701|nr:carnitine O-acetyltransferase isoform X1 [Gadus chalcogrammus]
MWGILTRTTFKMGMEKTSGLVRPVSATKLAGRFLAHQEGLPSLPVPALQQTCDRYLAVLEPIVETEKLKRTRELVTDFQKAGGVGERLQKSLEKRAQGTENWCLKNSTPFVLLSLVQLSDWWVLCAYLDYRLPVVIHSNPGLLLPRFDFRDKQGQLRHAAKLIAGVLDFKAQVDNETLPVEHMGRRPLCMNQYYQLLSSCRVPGIHRDSVVNHAKGPTASRHMVVAHHNQFFTLDVYNGDGSPLNEDQLLVQLRKICEASPQSSEEPVGILTSQDRNVWGKAYLELIKDPTNKESVEAIQRSIFTLSLDSMSHHALGETDHSGAAQQMLHGGGSHLNSGNRWFDKTLQFILGEDGMFGLNYEHAPAEGPPIVALIDHVEECMKKADMAHSPTSPLPAPRKLHFNITPDIRRHIEEAKLHLNTMVQQLDLKMLVFKHFGKNIPKSFKMSPDAFIQIGLQLAYYRLHQKPCSTYESASLRMFRLGRTDTIRSASTDSSNFAKAFDDPGKKNAEKVALLERAIKAHRAYTEMAIQGQAIDRHLLGLKLQAIEEQVSLPEIFTDPSYAAAMHFKMSTSQVPAKSDCVMCFGPVVEDGYGVCYNPKDKHINLVVSSFSTCQETDTGRMVQGVEAALLDMRTLLEATPKAKL